VITGWLLKLVLSFALLGVVVFEAGSPLLTRAQIDGVAHDAADAAGLELVQHGDAQRAQQAAEAVAADNDVELKAFTVDAQGLAHVTVEREARSLVLKNWDRTAGWYDVEVSATGGRQGRQ
jgi:Flp pilus assembly protein TadG